MAKNIYTTERCRNCKRQEFQYDEPNLTCLRCGAVNYTEEISPDEMDQLVKSLKSVSMTQEKINPRFLEFAQEYDKTLANRPIEDQLSEMRIERQKLPLRRKQNLMRQIHQK